MAIQRLVAGLELHTTPHISDIGENYPKRGNSQLFGARSLCHSDLHVDFSSDLSTLGRGHRGTSPG